MIPAQWWKEAGIGFDSAATPHALHLPRRSIRGLISIEEGRQGEGRDPQPNCADTASRAARNMYGFQNVKGGR
jgi:hypothetical protein